MLNIILLAAVTMMTACSDDLKEIFAPSDESVAVSALATELGFSKDQPLVMGMNTSYAPLQYTDDKGTPKGYDVEFTKVLLKRMGIPYAFSPNHWDKMSPGIIEGKYDMGMLVYSPYRKELTNYSNAVFRMYYQIVFRSKDYEDFDFRNVKGKKIAYMKSRPIGLMLKKEHAVDIPVTDLAAAFSDLAKGKYDGVICYRFQAKYEIGLLHLEDKLQAEELSLEPREYCYASHDPRLIEAINEELKRMEAEGIIDEVYGDNVLTQFGMIKIPTWVWVLLMLLTIMFLAIYSIYRYRTNKKLRAAHEQLQKAYAQLEENNEKLKIANARAEESTRMKSNFIKQISHEIRTPLNIMSGFTQLITSPGINLSEKDRKEASAQILQSTDRITGLVNKMLELSDISSQTVLQRNDEATAVQIAQQAIMDTGILDARHVAFELRKEAGANTPFRTDLRASARIVELLLDNAVKFTKPAESTVPQEQEERKERVTMTISADSRRATFIIENTGTSIPEEEAEHIFDEFVQLDEYYNGTGIGLTVARSLARRLGGDVVLDTTCTACTRFIATLGIKN
jgi:signal transduction histidine kinase